MRSVLWASVVVAAGAMLAGCPDTVVQVAAGGTTSGEGSTSTSASGSSATTTSSSASTSGGMGGMSTATASSGMGGMSTATASSGMGGMSATSTSATTTASSGGGGGATSCLAGQKECGTSCVSEDDPMYGCGPTTCAPCDLPHATPVCSNGACVLGLCDPGYAVCDDMPMNGCETNLQTDPDNCGACATVCNLPNATSACVMGKCVVAVCNPGYADCDPASPGCETNLNSDPNNCGMCGNVCLCTPSCTGGACVVIECPAGFTNCSGNCADGCNVELGTNENCCACGDTCDLPNSSSSCDVNPTGVGCACDLDSCNPGWLNCDMNDANGCETSAMTIPRTAASAAWRAWPARRASRASARPGASEARGARTRADASRRDDGGVPLTRRRWSAILGDDGGP